LTDVLYKQLAPYLEEILGEYQPCELGIDLHLINMMKMIYFKHTFHNSTLVFSGGEDEAECGNCENYELYCIVQGVKTCLSAHFLCDGRRDCGDGLVSGSYVYSQLYCSTVNSNKKNSENMCLICKLLYSIRTK
jgi:hypothetical protein